MAKLRVTCLQLEPPSYEEPLLPFYERILSEIASLTNADLVVLPELWHVGYFCFDRYREAAVSPDGFLISALAEAARSASVTLHVGSLLEAGEELHNTSFVFDPDGQEVGRYRKVHVFGYGSRERSLVVGGSELATFPLSRSRAGMAICYDLRFPELFRELADNVALYVVPATWPASRIEHWLTLLRARAIENLAFVVGCNTSGTNAGVALGGRSAVIGPWGEVVADAGSTPGRLETVIDLDDVVATRAEFPALRDRIWRTMISAPLFTGRN